MNHHLKRLLAFLLVLTMLAAELSPVAAAAGILTLPSSVKIIEDEAFYGDSSIEKVIVPEGATEIGSKAFGASSVKEIELPGTLEKIAGDAFADCEEVLFICEEDSLAYSYAQEHDNILLPEDLADYPESQHPYPDSFNHTWVYDAGEDAENVTILFSQETEVEEDFDFITIRTLGGTEVGTYTGKELAGASILVESAGFQITLNSDEAWGSANACYGFKIEDISVKRLIPLRFDSLTAEADSLAVGETIRWNVEISGGKGDVFCDYLVLLGQEEVASGTVEAPGTIEYMPLCVGEYRLIATVRDSGGTELPMKTSTAVTATPSTAYPESAHPYAASADMTWAYAADNEVESLFVTFSEDTQTESGKDFIYLYDRTGAQIGKYSGTELAGQTIEIFGASFSIRLTSNASVDGYGFSIESIRHYIPGPLTFVSLTPDKAKAKVGDLITWTMETAEGRSPVTYAYSVTLGEEEVASGTATRPEGIEFVPTAAGDYTVSVTATDAEGVSLPAQTSAVRIAAREVSPAELFTYQTINGLYCRISGYTGTDPVVIVPETLGEYTVQEIGKGVFQDHQELVSVLLPDTVTTVQDNAFRNCDSLKLVDFGAGITAIRANAFYDCDGLVSFTFPDTVTTTGASVLRYCDNLREVHFSASWATAGEYTLADCPRITALSFPEGLAQIPANAFRQCKNIESVILPTGMLTLGKDAFNNCTNLKNITFNEELLTISDGAFYQCAGLTELVIPDSVTYLGGLGKCTNLTSIQLPASLQTVGEDAFEYCSGLTELEFSETLKTIGDGAFQHCTGLTDVVFLGGLEYLGIQAFRGCTNLENALLPDTVKTIGNHAFQDCKKLQEFHYPVSWEAVNNYTANGTGHILEGCVNVTKVEIPEGVTRIPELAFYGCVYLKEITFPTTLKIIDHQALEGCTGLTELVFHEGLETIGKYTFQDCINLEHALLPDSVKTIGNHAFLNCVKLQEFRYPVSWASVTNYTINGRGDILEGCVNVTEITVPEGATRIPDYAFWGMVQLAKITLPSTLTEIGDNAFGNCTGLTEIEFPGSLKKIGDGAFQQCTGFTEFNFPNGLETVGIQAFLNCENLEDALLPDSVKTIGNHAFQGCAKLNAFHYPLNWTSVNNYTANGTGHILEGCVEVTEVTIPEGVTKIPEYAFFGCTVLENIIFPTTLKTIDDHAIEGCTGLTALTFHQGLETVGRYAFQDCTNLQYALLPDSVKTIGNHAFLNCGSLKAFHHPVSWTKVDNYTLGGRGHILEGCENVTEVVIPEGVTKIPAFAYFGASHVTNFVLPSTLKTIDANAFGDCTGFTYLAIPHGVTTIGANAFDGCENAEKIYVPTSVTSIDKTAFANCPKLTIHCEWGSYALQFAINNSLPYFYLSLTGASWPAGTLYRGNDFGLYGYVRASEPISSITATIYNWDGSQVLQTVTVNPYVLDYGLAGAINANLRFQDLPLGSYCYTLVATAGEETELMQQTTFSIVPPPLAIYVQDGATPSGLYSAASQIPFGGTIVSNYLITSVHAALTNMDTGATVREGWASPNAYSYALGNLSGQLSFATLGDGQYFLKVTAVSNGETRVLSEAGFQLLVGAGEITEEMYDDLIAFASKAANRNVFSTQYAAQVVQDMKAVDGIILFYDNLMSASLRDLIKQTCSLGDNDQLVKLYKRELIDMIDAGNYGGFDPIVSNTELHDLLLGSLQEGGTIAIGLGLSEEVETLVDTINTGLGELEKFTSAVGELNELYELLISVTLNAERGMQVLDFLSQSYGSAVNNELRTALYELKQAYISDCAAVTHGVFDILKDVALDEAEDAVGKLAGKLAEKITDMSFNLGTSLIKVTSKLAMTATGLDSVAESYRVFFVRYDVLIVSINSYWKAFDRVKNGDHSAEALAALSTAIHITRSAWIRHREAICGILSAVYSIGNAALEYENSAAFRALKDLTPVSMR